MLRKAGPGGELIVGIRTAEWAMQRRSPRGKLKKRTKSDQCVIEMGRRTLLCANLVSSAKI
ncbi:hypothetical protein CLV83_4195 [Marinobacterium mangrovicola]|uniref:Uncharacterized protein n=1 Tax=Marinobacterium mangrovicola TaxID=1476959 RepID=A0A4V2PCZ2_9GAMM|nr:hypothetical protein CLV83_4195 [Marinobacterium mangrovicola]